MAFKEKANEFRFDGQKVDERTKKIAEAIASGGAFCSTLVPSWSIVEKICASGGKPNLAESLSNCFAEDPGLLESPRMSPAVFVWGETPMAKKGKDGTKAVAMVYSSLEKFVSEVEARVKNDKSASPERKDAASRVFDAFLAASHVVAERKGDLAESGSRVSFNVSFGNPDEVRFSTTLSSGAENPPEERETVFLSDGSSMEPEDGFLPASLGGLSLAEVLGEYAASRKPGEEKTSDSHVPEPVSGPDSDGSAFFGGAGDISL